MIIHEYEIPYKYGDTITLKPFFDIHWGNKACDKIAFKKDLKKYGDAGAYLLFGGDIIDSIVATDPRYKKSIDDTKGDAIIDEQIDGVVEALRPYKDQIIGIGSGNHEEKIVDKCGTNPISRMCKEIGCASLGYSGLIKLKLSEGGSRVRTVIARWHHGWGGGGRTLGGSVTKYSKDIMYWQADIFLYGHDHQNKTDRIERMGLSGKNFIAKPKMIGVCGTYLKTFLPTADPTYSERAGYPPTRIGGIEVKITPNNRWVDMEMVN